jgi:hypothetical protein
MFRKYRVYKKDNRYFVQRRFLFVKWINVADYDSSYKANMIKIALENDNS